MCANWTAPTVPYLDGILCYYVYESAAHHTKAKYLYWHRSGIAGCLLKPMGRTKLGINNLKLHEILGSMSPPVASGRDDSHTKIGV